MTPGRPILRYHGGKWRLAPWIIRHLPPHRIYVEPYGGAGSVLLRKYRSFSEIYNDLDGEIVNLFKAVRDNGDELKRLLALTPFSRNEYLGSFDASADPSEQARRTMVRSYMGFGSNSLCRDVKSGFRSNSRRRHTTPAHDWTGLPASLDAIIARFQGVVIENRDALEVMERHDGPDTLHYLDPPYVHSTRALTMHGNHGYTLEMTDAQHIEMAEFVRGLKGAVVISGYRCDLYDSLFDDWERVDRDALADGAAPRVESLWICPWAQRDILFSQAR